MITNPEYNKIDVSCHQNWVNLYWNFKTKKEAENKIRTFINKYPNIHINSGINEQTIWIDSQIDTGKRYYVLSMSFGVNFLKEVFK